METLSQKLSARADARGWPQLRFRPSFYYMIDRVTQKRTKIILSNMACDADQATVTVCGGRSSWQVFLAQADYHDLVAANAALTTDDGVTPQADSRHEALV
jgi:hypothetical protein